LRALLGRLDGRSGGGSVAGVVPLGVPALDAVLPGGGLARGALHEIVAAAEDGAAAGFAAALIARLAGPAGMVLWCGAAGLYGPGLARVGLAPERLVLVEVTRPAERLWALEEALRTPGLAVAIAELPAGRAGALDLTASRRLQLAAEATGAIGLVLHLLADPKASIGPSAAVTRWRVASVPSGPPFDPVPRDFGLMRARWRVTLERCRGALPAPGSVHHGDWLMEEGDAAGALPVARVLADRPVASAAVGVGGGG
jgi:protein ImuA